MKTFNCMKLGLPLAGLLAFAVSSAQAASSDSFGSGANAFTIDFVSVLNAGNADDAGAGGGLFSSPHGGVLTDYRMGKFEISQDQIDKATASGLANVIAGAHTGAEPAANITWYEAAAFVNWLNTSTNHQAAYNLSSPTALTLWSSSDAWDNDPGTGVDLNLYRHKAAYYFLPSEDEWYKAAYHQNDGMTANYWDFATGSNSAPAQELTGASLAGSAVYDGAASGIPADPAEVNLAGGLSPYGTIGQNGNVFEWQESAFKEPNDFPSEARVFRGGFWGSSEDGLRSSARVKSGPALSYNNVGFRVASVPAIVPEPSAMLFGAGLGLLCVLRRRRASYFRPIASR